MKTGKRTWAAALLALALAATAGCDAVVVGVLAARSNKSSSSGSASPAVPDAAYKIYVKALGPAADLDAEKAALEAAGGLPDASWVLAGTGTATQEIDVSALPGGPFSTVLIQAPEAEVYHIDALELLDSAGVVIETAAAASIRSDELSSPEAAAASTPDGLTADTSSTPTARAWLFARFAAPLGLFRASLWGSARASGDVEWAKTFASAGNQTAGGAAAKADGSFYVTYSDESPRHVWLITYLADGNAPGVPAGDPPVPVSLETNVTATAGSQSVAINGANVYTATTFGGGDIRVSKIEGPGPNWAVPFSGGGIDRVEANALAVDPGGNLVVAGGFDFGVGGIGHFLQMVSASGGILWAGSPTPPPDTNDTYWHAVVAPSGVNIYTTGDLFSATPVPGSIQVYTRRSDSGSSGAEIDSKFDAGPGTEADVGRAIGTDGAGSVYVAGYHGAAGPSRNAFIRKYSADLSGSVLHVTSALAGDDEILDIAVEADGTVYATGYETVTSPAQGRNLFLKRIAPNGTTVWTRTLHGGFGDDRGVSVSATSTHVYVAGDVTVSGGTRDVHVRRYVK